MNEAMIYATEGSVNHMAEFIASPAKRGEAISKHYNDKFSAQAASSKIASSANTKSRASSQ